MEHLLALEDMHLAPVGVDESGIEGGASPQALSPVLWSTHARDCSAQQDTERWGLLSNLRRETVSFLLVVQMQFS